MYDFTGIFDRMEVNSEMKQVSFSLFEYGQDFHKRQSQ